MSSFEHNNDDYISTTSSRRRLESADIYRSESGFRSGTLKDASKYQLSTPQNNASSHKELENTRNSSSSIMTLKSPKFSKKDLIASGIRVDKGKKFSSGLEQRRTYHQSSSERSNHYSSRHNIPSNISSSHRSKGNMSFDSLNSDMDVINDSLQGSSERDYDTRNLSEKMGQQSRSAYLQDRNYDQNQKSHRYQHTEKSSKKYVHDENAQSVPLRQEQLDQSASSQSTNSFFSEVTAVTHSMKSMTQKLTSRVPSFQNIDQGVWKSSLDDDSVIYFEPRIDESFFVTIQCEAGTFTHHSLIPLSSTPEKWNNLIWSIFFSPEKNKNEEWGYVWNSSRKSMILWLNDATLQVRYEWKLTLIDQNRRDMTLPSLERLPQSTLDLNSSLVRRSNSNKNEIESIRKNETLHSQQNDSGILESILQQLKHLEEKQLRLEESTKIQNNNLNLVMKEKVGEVKMIENRLKMLTDSVIQRMPDISSYSGFEQSSQRDLDDMKNQYLQLVSDNQSLSRIVKKLSQETESQFKEMKSMLESLSQSKGENLNNKQSELTIDILEEYIDEARTDFGENIMKVAKKVGSLEDAIILSNENLHSELEHIRQDYEQWQSEIEERFETIDHASQTREADEVVGIMEELKELKELKEMKEHMESELNSFKELQQNLRQELKQDAIEKSILEKIHEAVYSQFEVSVSGILEDWVDKYFQQSMMESINDALNNVLDEKVLQILDPILSSRFEILRGDILENMKQGIKSVIEQNEKIFSRHKQEIESTIEERSNSEINMNAFDSKLQGLRNEIAEQIFVDVQSNIIEKVEGKLHSVEAALHEKIVSLQESSSDLKSILENYSRDVAEIQEKLQKLPQNVPNTTLDVVHFEEKIERLTSYLDQKDADILELSSKISKLEESIHKMDQSSEGNDFSNGVKEMKSIMDIIQGDLITLQSDSFMHKRQIYEIHEMIARLDKNVRTTQATIQDIIKISGSLPRLNFGPNEKPLNVDSLSRTPQINNHQNATMNPTDYQVADDNNFNLSDINTISLQWSPELKQAEIELDKLFNNMPVIRCNITDKRYPMSILSKTSFLDLGFFSWKLQVKNWDRRFKIYIGVCDPNFSFSNFVGFFSRSWSLELQEGIVYNGENVTKVHGQEERVDIITIVLNMMSLPGSLGFAINDKWLGYSFNNLYPPLNAAITFEGQGEITQVSVPSDTISEVERNEVHSNPDEEEHTERIEDLKTESNQEVCEEENHLKDENFIHEVESSQQMSDINEPNSNEGIETEFDANAQDDESIPEGSTNDNEQGENLENIASEEKVIDDE